MKTAPKDNLNLSGIWKNSPTKKAATPPAAKPTTAKAQAAPATAKAATPAPATPAPATRKEDPGMVTMSAVAFNALDLELKTLRPIAQEKANIEAENRRLADLVGTLTTELESAKGKLALFLAAPDLVSKEATRKAEGIDGTSRHAFKQEMNRRALGMAHIPIVAPRNSRLQI